MLYIYGHNPSIINLYDRLYWTPTDIVQNSKPIGQNFKLVQPWQIGCHLKAIYTTKIMESVCVCICMYVCPAMRFAMLWGIELKVGMGVGDGPTRFVGTFSKRPHLGSKVIQRSICLRNALWLPNLVRRAPDQSVGHCWGQRSGRGHQGSIKGQIA